MNLKISHYIRNSNQRYGSEMRAKEIISNLEKRDAFASPRSMTDSVEGKKEMIFFSACLN
jgi:hypothetical protein